MSKEKLEAIAKKIQLFNHITNEIIESNKFINIGFEFFKKNQHFIIEDFDINNEYLNVLKEHIVIHCQFTLINLYKILYESEKSSLPKIYNSLKSCNNKQRFINNIYYDSFINSYSIFEDDETKKSFINKIKGLRDTFYAHSDIIEVNKIDFNLDFYFKNLNEINQIIDEISILNKFLLQCFFDEFKDDKLIENINPANKRDVKTHILTAIDNRGKPINSNHETFLYKILDLYEDLSSIQKIILNNSNSSQEKIELIDKILIKDKINYNDKTLRFYKYI